MPNFVQVSGRMPYTRSRTERKTSEAAFGISLLRRRSWFADSDGRDAQADERPPEGDGADDLPHNIADDEELRKLRADIDRMQDRLKEVNAEAARRRKEKEAALEETGNWERLAKEREMELTRMRSELEAMMPHKDRSEALLASIRERNEARIGQIPESHRTLVPTGLSPEAVADFLDRNWQLLTVRPAPNVDAGAGSGGSKTQSARQPVTAASERDQAAANMAAQYGIPLDPERIAARRAQIENRRKKES